MDIDGLFAPGIFWPLLIDLALAFAVSAWSKRVLWRVLAWLIIPIVVAFVATGPHLSQSGEAGGWAFLGLLCLLAAGPVASGIGMLLGFFVYRLKTAK